MPWPLGVVAIVYGSRPIREAARLARDHGFAHIDTGADVPDDLAVPIGDRFSMLPRSGCSSGPSPEGTRSWEQTVKDFRKHPDVLMEPWPGSVVGSNEAVLAMLDEVPGLRLNLDVGHVTAWGGDPLELLPYAAHVQLRQARLGQTQALAGDVDIPGILKRLAALDYGGLLSIEYFDLPDRGWPFDDPVAAALEIASQVRPLL